MLIHPTWHCERKKKNPQKTKKRKTRFPPTHKRGEESGQLAKRTGRAGGISLQGQRLGPGNMAV